MHMDTSQKPFCCEIYWENTGRESRDTRFVRACAVEVDMDMSQDAFYAEIYRDNAKRPGYHLDWTPALNCYHKNPAVWPHCLGKYQNVGWFKKMKITKSAVLWQVSNPASEIYSVPYRNHQTIWQGNRQAPAYQYGGVPILTVIHHYFGGPPN